MDTLTIETILVGIETAGVLAILIIEVINLRDLRGQRRIGKDRRDGRGSELT